MTLLFILINFKHLLFPSIMAKFDELNQEFQALKDDVNHSNYPRLKEIYNIFSRQASDLFKTLNDFNNQLSNVWEVTHESIITYWVYDATVWQIDQFGARLNIQNSKFQAKVDLHHLQSYESYKRTTVSKWDKMKIIVVTHKHNNDKRITNAVFQKYPWHEYLFRFYEIHNKDLTIDNIRMWWIYKWFVNGIVPDRDCIEKWHVFVCLRSDISWSVRVNKLKDYEIWRIVDVKVIKKNWEKTSTNRLRESRDWNFDFYI